MARRITDRDGTMNRQGNK